MKEEKERKIGAQLGGVVYGAAKSYKRHEEIKGWTLASPMDISHPVIVDRELITAGYASTKDKVSESDYALGLSWGLDSCSVRIAILHNKVLEEIEILKSSSEIKKDRLSNLSSFERQLVESEEFIIGFDKTIYAIPIDQSEPQTIGDNIMTLFISEMSRPEGDHKRVNRIIAHYTTTVKETKELSEEEKQSLYIGFAVMGYSFEYWTAIYSNMVEN